MIDLVVFNGEELVPDDNLASWTIFSVSERLIEIDLVFKSSLQVSKGDSNDKLLVQVALSQFLDHNSNNLPVSINRIKDIPR